MMYTFYFVFFFKQKTAYEMRISDWSSDVCSSDLIAYVVNSCRTFVKEAAANAGLTLHSVLPEGLPTLYADKRAVRQILLNLLSNAIKFTPAGGRVAVEARVEPAGGLSPVVRDTGIGMTRSEEHTSELQSLMRSS